MIQRAYQLIPRSPTCLVEGVFDLGCHSCAVYHDDQPPWVVVNRVNPPHATLPTLLSFSRSHAFRDGSLGMIWDSYSFNMERPNVDEKEWAMGFCIGTTIMQGIFERAYKRILGQVVPYGSLLPHMGFEFWSL